MKWALMALWTSMMGSVGFTPIHHFASKEECEAAVKKIEERDKAIGFHGVVFCQEEKP